MNPTQSATGVIVSRKCPTCGHHEIGYMDSVKTFHPLTPGDMIQVLKDGSPPDSHPLEHGPMQDAAPLADDSPVPWAAWAPEPVKTDKSLRLKYGVLVNRDLLTADMPPGLYGIAFRQKLQRLIDEEKFTPLPVIFDRFFGAPQLAAGDPLQMTESLMEEIEALSSLPDLVRYWLVKKDDESLIRLIRPKSPKDLGTDTIDDEQFKKELETLTLETFFDLL